jgi:transmembrane protein EpsG
MGVSLIVIFLILTIGFQFSRGKTAVVDSDKNRKKYIKIISFILILQSGLRNVAVGSDTYIYYTYFEDIKKTSWNAIFQNFIDVYQLGEGKDAGYLLFQKIVQIFTSENQVFLLVIATLFFTALGNFIYKNTTRLSDAIMAFIIYSVLFYSFFSITGHRQTIATAAALYGFEFIKKRKIIPFAILLICAATIHKSVVLFAPFYFIAPIKKSKQLNWVMLLLLPVFMVNRNAISTYFKVLGGFEEYGINQEAGTFTFTAMFLLIAIVALKRSDFILKSNPNMVYAFNAFALALLFIPLTWVNPSAMRVVQYFSIFMLLLVPEIIHSFALISAKLKRDITIVVFIVLIALMVKANANAAPYGFFWQDMHLQKEYYN